MRSLSWSQVSRRDLSFHLHQLMNLRRLRCNRSSPCENCIKRGDTSSCSYAAPGSRRKTNSKSAPSGTPDDMQNRIDRLEGLVLSLMTGNDSMGSASANRTMSISGSTPSQDFTPPQGSEEHFREDDSVESETDKIAKSFGVLHVHNSKAMYISDSHWASVLTEVGFLTSCERNNHLPCLDF